MNRQRLAVDTTGMKVASSQVAMMSKLMDAAALRQRVIGQNIANVNTPRYERREVVFEESLTKLLGHEDASSMIGNLLPPKVVATQGLTKRVDGNNVKIEMELGQLTKNEILFNTFSQILATDLSMIRTAITGQ